MKRKLIGVIAFSALLLCSARSLDAEVDTSHLGDPGATGAASLARPDAATAGSPKLYDLKDACTPERLGLTGRGGAPALGVGSAGGGSGAALFAMRCGSCHGVGKSQGPIKDKNLGAERVLGISARGAMPPTGLLPDVSEREAIADFLRSQ